MPTIFRSGPYRFFFYAGDRAEPPHVHVEREHRKAKFWLDPVRLQRSREFSRQEIKWRLIGRGEGIHWIDLDEDISVENLLYGKPSGESQRSFKNWLDQRKLNR